MTLKGMYDKIAENYAMANRFGAISESHAVAISQLKSVRSLLRKPLHILDLGVGDGGFIQKLSQFMPEAAFIGVDISTEMLKRAKERLPDVHTIECSATEVNRYVPPSSQDLVLAHFINAYIPINDLFKEARHLTRANGYFSLITTTYDSFPVAQQQLAEYIAEGGLSSRVVGHYYKSIVRNTTVASSQDALLKTFAEHHFDIVAHQRLELPVYFENIEELARFGIDGTWFLNTLSVRMLPKEFLIQRLHRLFSKIFTFPYHDTHVIDVVLAKK